MFLDVPVKPGEVTRQRVPIGELADGTPLTLPVVTIGGNQPGPTLYLQAGIHGDELTGVEICRRAITSIDPTTITGTVVAVPLANVPAYLTRTRGYRNEERWLIDINRIFPGSPHGLLTERLAHTLFEEFIRQADFTIDFHSALAGCDIAPFVYVDPDDDNAGTLEIREQCARAFGTPYVFLKPRSAKLGTSDLSRSLSAKADAASLPVIIAEMGESVRVSRERLPLAMKGVENVMKSLGMVDGEPQNSDPQRDFRTVNLVHAERGGGLRLVVELGDEVTQGQVIGQIVDVFGDEVERLEAPCDGFVLRVMRLGSVATGAEVLWIAA